VCSAPDGALGAACLASAPCLPSPSPPCILRPAVWPPFFLWHSPNRPVLSPPRPCTVNTGNYVVVNSPAAKAFMRSWADSRTRHGDTTEQWGLDELHRDTGGVSHATCVGIPSCRQVFLGAGQRPVDCCFLSAAQSTAGGPFLARAASQPAGPAVLADGLARTGLNGWCPAPTRQSSLLA
jgi:hypothetical protein